MPPRLARLLAVVAAVVLVIGAFALRGSLSGDDDEGVSTGSGNGDEPSGSDDGPFQVLCDEDLGDAVCDRLDESESVDRVEVVRRSEVAGMIADAEGVRWDAWLTLDPMPSALDAERREDGLPNASDEDAVVVVASANLAVLTFEDSPLTCLGGEATWQCLTQEVRPKVAVASPSTSIGAVSTAAGAAGLMEATDFDVDDFADAPAGDAMSDLLADVPSSVGKTSADQTEAIYRSGTTSGVVTIDGLAARRVETDQGRGRGLHVLPLTPSVRVGVVLAGIGGEAHAATRALDDLVTGQNVRDALKPAGWTGPAERSLGVPPGDLVFAILEELS